MKTAYIIQATSNYFPGLVAILNGLDYHGNEMDVLWIYSDEGEKENQLSLDLLAQAKAAGFCYDIIGVPISEIIAEHPECKDRRTGWKFRYCGYAYVRMLAGVYDAVMLAGADLLVLNYIEPWLELVAGTKYLLSANHSWAGCGNVLNLHEGNAASTEAIADVPLILAPDAWTDMLDLFWEFGRDIQTRGSNLHAFNWAIWKSQRAKDVVYLPECQWICHHMWFLKMRKQMVDGRIRFMGDQEIRYHIYTVHGKWFKRSNCDAKAGQGHEALAHNVKLMHNEYCRLITQHKLGPEYPGWERAAKELQPYA